MVMFCGIHMEQLQTSAQDVILCNKFEIMLLKLLTYFSYSISIDKYSIENPVLKFVSHGCSC